MIQKLPDWADKIIEEHDAKVNSGEIVMSTHHSKEELFRYLRQELS